MVILASCTYNSLDFCCIHFEHCTLSVCVSLIDHALTGSAVHPEHPESLQDTGLDGTGARAGKRGSPLQPDGDHSAARFTPCPIYNRKASPYTVPVNSHLLLFVYTEVQNSEIAEMVVQEGLAELATSSLSEQVAYLLADRAALMEKIQALEDADSKALNLKCPQKESTPDENAGKVRSLRNMCYFVVCVLKQYGIKRFWPWEPPYYILHQAAPLRGQSPWKRLLGFSKAAQTKQVFTHVCTILEKMVACQSPSALFYRSCVSSMI